MTTTTTPATTPTTVGDGDHGGGGGVDEELLKRPYTAYVVQRIDVDIDRSELGVWDVFMIRRIFDGRIRPALSWP